MTKVVHDTDVGTGLEIAGGKVNVAATQATDVEVDQAIHADNIIELAEARARLMPRIMLFDRAEHSKLSLPVVADTDPTKSKWMLVPNSYNLLTYPVTGKLIVVNFDEIVSYDGGYPGYATDTSHTVAQFCVAPFSSNSDEINANLASSNQNPPLAGEWSSHVDRVIAASVAQGGTHPYSKLWVRYINLPARPGDVAQNITQFGGNCHFKINSMHVYDSISNGL